MHPVKTAMLLLALPVASVLSGCCSTSTYDTPFQVTDDDTAEPCEDFCERVIAGDDAFSTCKVIVSPDEPPTIVCTFEHTYCEELM